MYFRDTLENLPKHSFKEKMPAVKQPDCHILYVDDEPLNLTIFELTFKKDYQVHLAASAAEGFEILEQQMMKVVVSDQRMPQMTGTDFLAEVSLKYPDTIRILLTAYTDNETILEAINRGRVYSYMTKPWKKDDLRITIEHAIEAYNLKAENRNLVNALKKANLELEAYSHSLEDKVKERTYELEEKTRILNTTNKKLSDYQQEINQFAEELCYQLEELRAAKDKIEKQKQTLDDTNAQLIEKQHKIELQNQEIRRQRDDLQLQKNKIEDYNEDLKASIRYAKTIQQAILPIRANMDKFLDHFIIYRPKAIVSGDFYWCHHIKSKKQQSEKTWVAVADCTGHGVPGALLAMIGNSQLNDLVKVQKLDSPAEVLERLNSEIKSQLKQEQTRNDDGMDIALCLIEKHPEKGISLLFAGAKRPLFYLPEGQQEIVSIKGVNKPIGGKENLYYKDIHFIDNRLKINKGDQLYLTSDGIIDQNDDDMRKIGTRRFVELLEENSGKTLDDQCQALEVFLDEHQQNQEQRDDITVLGIKI